MAKIKSAEGRRQKRKLQPGTVKKGGVIAAFVAAIVLFLVLLQIEKSVLEDYEKGTILVAASTIPGGQPLLAEECQSLLRQREMDKKLIPDSAVQTGEELEGKIARYDIEGGTLLTKGMFTGVEELTAGMTEPVVAGLKADDLYQVAGGVIRAGDRIHVYSVTEDKRIGRVWENLWVQSVFDQSGKEIRNPDQTGAAQRINVYLDKAEVSAFYTELASGTLRVVKACQ